MKRITSMMPSQQQRTNLVQKPGNSLETIAKYFKEILGLLVGLAFLILMIVLAQKGFFDRVTPPFMPTPTPTPMVSSKPLFNFTSIANTTTSAPVV